MASCVSFCQQLIDLFFRSDNTQLPSLNQLNDSVYEFHSPPDGTSFSSEIIFFHGLERGDYSQAYVETWTSLSESTGICWPQTLLARDFPTARILSVSYDSSIESGPRQGKMDLYLTAENLLQDLLDGAKVAKNPGLPVILVGKDLGGLVIKAICMEAKAQNRFKFLSNLKGIFYYGTPHLGIQHLPTAFNGALAERLAFGDEIIARLNSNFSKHRKNKWSTRAIMSLQRSTKVPELVISEASQRCDADQCYMSNCDIDTVCKCQGTKSSSFKFLTGFISTIQEKGELLFESFPDRGGILEEGLVFKTSLSFENDGNYVPMATTRADIENALQIARIVILHGGPGSGKSSLARHLALRFEGTAQQQCADVTTACSAEQHSWVPNGVVYMTCGEGAEILSLQRELLRKFDIEVSLADKSTTLDERGGTVELQKINHQKLVDHLSKLRFRVVVVLDDVWDTDLLENLLVPGDKVKYLLTAQISTLWNAYDSKTIQMQDVTLEDARRILGNYAKFEGGVISKDLESLADEIIAATGSHPLALATLGVVLDNMGRTVVDWQELKDNLQEYLKTEDYQPSSFGQKYALSVDASMTFVLDFLDEDAKKLLYKITLFDGPFIPETLLRLFLRYTLPRDQKINISTSKTSLVTKGLVRTESQTDEDTKFEMRVLWIHSLRQHFILTRKTKEIDQITDFLDDDSEHEFLHSGKRSELDFATALCALYGTTRIKKRARRKMGSHFMWSEEYSDGLAYTLVPFVSLMLSEGDTKNRTSQAAIEVFWNLFICGTIDDLHIEILLHEQECIALTCNLILKLVIHNKMLQHENETAPRCVTISAMTLSGTITKLISYLSTDHPMNCANAVQAIVGIAMHPQNRLVIVRFPSCLQRLVALLAHNVDETIVDNVIWCLMYLVDCDDRVDILQTKCFLGRLVDLLTTKNIGICANAASTIGELAMAPENRVVIVRFPSCLQRLVALLAHNVDETIVDNVIWCLMYLVDCDDRVDILQTKCFLGRLVDLLTTKNIGICANAASTIGELAMAPENRVVIVRFPSCLQRLVALLAHNVDETIVDNVIWCLMYLVDCDDRVDILQTKCFLGRLVDLLTTKNIGICANAASTIGELAMAPENRVVIVRFPSCLQRLVALLAHNVDETIVDNVIWCLTYLVDCGDRVDILQTKCFLGRVVDLLTTKNIVICANAAHTIGELAMAPENRVVIVRFPSCLQRLVALLAHNVDETIVDEVIWCLMYLVDCGDRVDILQTKCFLGRVVDLLTTKNIVICATAANTIGKLAMAPENRVVIVRFPSCLQRLVALLAHNVDETIVDNVIWCLTYLVDCGDRVDILQTKCFLGRVVDLLTTKNIVICATAAHTIGKLAMAPENRVVIVRFPSCLQRLVALLAHNVDETIVDNVIWCLTYLVDCGDRVDILQTKCFLGRVVDLLTTKNIVICANAVHTIGELAMAPENRVVIVRFPSCLQRLVALLAHNVDETIVDEVIWCLQYLVDCDDKENVLKTPLLLERLTMLASSKDNTNISRKAAQIVGFVGR